MGESTAEATGAAMDVATGASRYMEAVRRRVVVFDGAMGTTIQRLGLTAQDYGGAATEGCNEWLTITRPDVIQRIHESFLAVGVDVVETDSFTASRLKLDEYGLGAHTRAVNLAAARLARAAVDRFSAADQPRFVAGSIGPTGMLPSGNDPLLSAITYPELVAIFREQADALIEGGVDLLVIETSQDILEVRATITGIRQACAARGVALPIQAQVTLDTSGRMLLGTDIAAAMTILVNLGVDVIGMNCSTGPQQMREPVRYLSEHCPLPISTIPNAGLPLNVNGQAVYPLEPEPMAAQLAAFVAESGVNVIGGCCGTTPDHLAAIIAAIRALPESERDRPQRRLAERVAEPPAVASGIRAASLIQIPAPLIVGERVNAQGSKKIKQALLADDYDTLLTVARDQVEWGAHALDVQVALTERGDEAEQMRRAVKTLSMGIEAPLVLDSTEVGVLQAALETYPGRAIINSVNLENGRGKVAAVFPLAREHGAAVVALTIDEEGMAKTVARKVAVAQRIFEIATTEYGLPPDALIFDVLTFPVTTGQEDLRDAAAQTLAAIRRVKEALPGALTILGVSNVSFGVAPHARAALNSVFLYHAVREGLDLAIVNPAHITPYAEIDATQRQLCDDLIFDSDPDALPRFITYYEEHGQSRRRQDERIDPTEGLTTDQRLHYQILHRQRDGIEALIDTAIRERVEVQVSEGGNTNNTNEDELTRKHLASFDVICEIRVPDLSPGEAAVEVLNTVLLPAMKDVGDRFGAGELILPFVLQSAEVMKRAVAHLERYLERQEGYTKGRVVLATVFGDVHDIGKNLVNTILANNGYTVYDLGKQVPINTIIEKAIEVNADAIGLSALLVSTSKQMPLCVRELHERGLAIPVIIGGAAINRAYGRRVLFVEDAGGAKLPYTPGVFYARDAFEGLEIMDQLVDPARRAALVERTVAEAQAPEVRPAPATPVAAAPIPLATGPRFPAPIPTAPFFGPRALERIALEDLLPHLDRNALFRGRWGGKAHGATYERLVREDFEPRLADLLRRARFERTLEPRAVYGYFPCYAAGDDLVVTRPDDVARELTRFHFPRQPGGERLCLADYFATRERGPDVVALQVVTMGQRATERIDALQARGEFAAAFFLHGLSVQLAEALAEYVNAHIRAELGLTEAGGRRYSWGYPAIPDLADHATLFTLLPVTDTIGVTLTESYQLVPEQSTAALIVPNPAAVYFGVREN